MQLRCSVKLELWKLGPFVLEFASGGPLVMKGSATKRVPGLRSSALSKPPVHGWFFCETGRLVVVVSFVHVSQKCPAESEGMTSVGDG